MQIIVNCLLTHQEKGLLLLKPRKNWFVCPGGKVESTEHVQEAIIREYKEETNLDLICPELKAVSINVYRDGEGFEKKRLMLTFMATQFKGENFDACHEGTIYWMPLEEILMLDMAEGDRMVIKHMLQGEGILNGIFFYNTNEDLEEYRLSVMNH